MKDVLIYVPSKLRSTEIGKNTLRWLQYTKFDYKVFVEPQEEDDYSKVIPKGHLEILSKNNQGLWFSKLEAKKYAEKNGYKHIFKLDDDIRSWADVRYRGWKTQGKETPKRDYKDICENVFEPMLEKCLIVFEAFEEVGGIGFMYRNEMFNHYPDVDFCTINRRFQSCYMVKTELFFCVKDTCVFEDFANFLHVLGEGYKTLTYHQSGQEYVPVGINSGGHQSFDRQKRCELAVEILSELFTEIQWKNVEGKTWDMEPDFRAMSKYINRKSVDINIENILSSDEIGILDSYICQRKH